MSFETNYPFEDKGILIGGVTVGSFDGTAVLSIDKGYMYVSTLKLDGYKRVPKPFYLLTVYPEVPNPIWLEKGKGSAFEQGLFEAIASQIENSNHAREHFEDAYELERAA